jgi:hypothetical protein
MNRAGHLTHSSTGRMMILGLLIIFHVVMGMDYESRLVSQWRTLSQMCRDRHYKSCVGIDNTNWTDVKSSKLSNRGISYSGLGKVYVWELKTFDATGQARTRGGDTWFVILRDKVQRIKLPVRVIDQADGTYLLYVALTVPGRYHLHAMLWYSDCHGLQEPTRNSTEERSYLDDLEKTMSKEDHCYVGQRIAWPVFAKGWTEQTREFVTMASSDTTCSSEWCESVRRTGVSPSAPVHDETKRPRGQSYRTELYHYRRNNSLHSVDCCSPPPLPKRAVKRVLLYGDSTMRNLWDILLYMARKPCRIKSEFMKPRVVQDEFKNPTACDPVDSIHDVDPRLAEILLSCTQGAPFSTVPVATSSSDILSHFPWTHLVNLSLPFVYNLTFAQQYQQRASNSSLAAILSTLPPPIGNGPEFSIVYIDGWGCRHPSSAVTKDLQDAKSGDVLVFNVGAHCQRSQTFVYWQRYVDEMAVALKKIMTESDVLVVWRSTWNIEENVFRSHPEHVNGWVPQAHFNTDARRILFDSYAEHVLLPLGVHVFDSYGLSSIGDNKMHDMFHVDVPTSFAMHRAMFKDLICP